MVFSGKIYAHTFNLLALAKDITGKMQEHPALSLEDLVGQFDDKSIGEDQVAKGLDVQQIFHLHSRRKMLAKDGIGDGSGT